ncbi:alkaline shock response membrane anchor protein AmaP [Alkalicella caledoniensis]|nr:alkaline shock response membrane anchor protein AmaP [Alkalicella caledoniensis]
MLFKQILGILLSLFVLLAAGLMFVISLDVGVLPQRGLDFLTNIQGVRELAFIFFGIIVLAIMYLVLNFKGKGQPTSILIPSELGEVRISLETIDSLVHQGTKGVKGIKDLKTRIVVREGGLFIYVKAVLYGDRNIPELSQTMQGVIGDHVFKISGVNVTEVKVLIENVATDIKARVS